MDRKLQKSCKGPGLREKNDVVSVELIEPRMEKDDVAPPLGLFSSYLERAIWGFNHDCCVGPSHFFSACSWSANQN